MKNYDFTLTREDPDFFVYTGSITRRYISAIIDSIIVIIFLMCFGLQGDNEIYGIINLVLLLIVTTLPEFITRQTIGMYICNLVVIVPPTEDPKKALLIRKIMHLIEFVLPSFIYYYHVALNKNNYSLSDTTSNCIVARKKYIIQGAADTQKLGKIEKFLSPLLFSFMPLILMISTGLLLVLIFNTDFIVEYIIKMVEHQK